VANEYWLGDQQWIAIVPLIPMNRRGVKPSRNREEIPLALKRPPTMRQVRRHTSWSGKRNAAPLLV
jgi:hypothetical protein